MIPETEYAAYYHTYIRLVKEADLIAAFTNHHEETFDIWSKVDESVGDYRYAEGKWIVKELLQHVIDTERIMAYRALTIARVPGADLPGYDENVYAQSANVNQRDLAEMVEEFHLLRQSNIVLFESFTRTMLERMGKADGNPVSVRALGGIIIGHALHHNNILMERYLN